VICQSYKYIFLRTLRSFVPDVTTGQINQRDRTNQ